MLLSKVLSHVNIASWDRDMIRSNVECCVSHLNWKTKLKIEKTDLAYILELGASLTDLGFLVSRIPTRSPPKHHERSCAYLAFLVMIR